MVFLVRDPRDVAASALDASREGSWFRHNARPTSATSDDMISVERFARTYRLNIGNAKQAYESHRGLKVLIRYEELRADTLGTMRRVYSALEIPVNDDELRRAVEKHAWEAIPEEEKGQGKFHRKASPGGWREDLTPEQAKVVEEITAPLLAEFYS